MGIGSGDSSSVVQQQKILKVLVLLLGVICIGSVVMLKGSFVGVGLWNWVRCLLSSPLYICIIINSMVLLIAALSNFQPQKLVSPPSLYQHDHHVYYSEVKREGEQMSSDKQLEEDTMEATWKAISRGAKDKKHLTKSETFIQEQDPSPSCRKDLKKSETFNEAVSIRRMRRDRDRDPSLGIDEFNQQVEAFIKKFNDDMRLQRQQSHQRFIDMINRGL